MSCTTLLGESADSSVCISGESAATFAVRLVWLVARQQMIRGLSRRRKLGKLIGAERAYPVDERRRQSIRLLRGQRGGHGVRQHQQRHSDLDSTAASCHRRPTRGDQHPPAATRRRSMPPKKVRNAIWPCICGSAAARLASAPPALNPTMPTRSAPTPGQTLQSQNRLGHGVRIFWQELVVDQRIVSSSAWRRSRRAPSPRRD